MWNLKSQNMYHFCKQNMIYLKGFKKSLPICLACNLSWISQAIFPKFRFSFNLLSWSRFRENYSWELRNKAGSWKKCLINNKRQVMTTPIIRIHTLMIQQLLVIKMVRFLFPQGINNSFFTSKTTTPST